MPNSIERLHYENPAFWAPDKWGDARPAIERARLAIEWLPPGTDSVLDVGCGNGVLANRLQDTHLVVGIDRSVAALNWLQTSRCQGDAVSLPFPDNAFDLVVSMELIEHLPVSTFRPALAEMVRVAKRYLLITVPYREKREHRQITCPICGCEFHPYYHVRSSDLPDLQRIFCDWQCITLLRVEGICPEQVPLFAGLWNVVRRTLNRGGRNFPWYATCPQCSYSTGEAPDLPAVRRQPSPDRFAKTFIRLIWPRKSEYAWWMALYVKGEQDNQRIQDNPG